MGHSLSQAPYSQPSLVFPAEPDTFHQQAKSIGIALVEGSGGGAEPCFTPYLQLVWSLWFWNLLSEASHSRREGTSAVPERADMWADTEFSVKKANIWR